jgi:hypothetical protein
MRDPECQDCGKALSILPDWSGRGRNVVVCFDCDPPRLLCEACAGRHGHADCVRAVGRDNPGPDRVKPLTCQRIPRNIDA